MIDEIVFWTLIVISALYLIVLVLAVIEGIRTAAPAQNCVSFIIRSPFNIPMAWELL